MSVIQSSPSIFLEDDRVSVRSVAIIRALQLGDLLLAVPTFRAIRRGFPNAEITLLGLRWSAEFARRFNAYIDRWREFPGYPGLVEVEYNPDRTGRFLEVERAYHYDLVLQCHGNGTTSNRFALDLWGRRTAGFYVGTPPDGLDPHVPYPDDLPEIERSLSLARALGLPADDTRLEFPILACDDENLNAALPDRAALRPPLIGLHPGARPAARRWPIEYFAEVADNLAQRYGATIIVTGGPGESPIVETLISQMTCRAVNLAERTTIGGLAALLQSVDLFISNDTGPAHLAVALHRPSITIFGPADRRRWAPLDQVNHRIAFHQVACSPCPYADCPIDHRCLRGVDPSQVLDLADELLSASAVEAKS